MTGDANPDAPLTKADADHLLKQVEQLLRGSGLAPSLPVPNRSTDIEESSPPRGSQETSGQKVDRSSVELTRALSDMPAHRSQRRERNLAPRVTYSLLPVQSAQVLRALQSLTPAAGAIIVYLATHPGSTVPELVAQLDLRRKTVQNLLSILKQRDLVQADPMK